jgi:Fe-S cluster biogenesis protein NfuA/nitrite reductase/ring-hydroxylating ferredoxin subunit
MTVADRIPAEPIEAPIGAINPTTEASAGPPLDARRVAQRITELVEEMSKVADPRLTERTEDLVRLLMQFYGAALERVLELADDSGVLEGALLDRLVDDELVASVLVLHDLHPMDVRERVQAALDRVRPYLGSHGGDVEILGIEDDVVRLRMEGSCSSCPSSTVTLNFAIEEAILKAAPEISRIVAEGVDTEAPASPLIQLAPRAGSAAAAHPGASGEHDRNRRTEWLAVTSEIDVAAGVPAVVELGGLHLLLCRSGDDLYAYRDHCPNCRSMLDDGRLAGNVLTCRVCGHSFDVRLAGRSTGTDEMHLEPLPLLAEAGRIRIAVPVGAA